MVFLQHPGSCSMESGREWNRVSFPQMKQKLIMTNLHIFGRTQKYLWTVKVALQRVRQHLPYSAQCVHKSCQKGWTHAFTEPCMDGEGICVCICPFVFVQVVTLNLSSSKLLFSSQEWERVFDETVRRDWWYLDPYWPCVFQLHCHFLEMGFVFKIRLFIFVLVFWELFSFYAYRCFACMYVCIPHVCSTQES